MASDDDTRETMVPCSMCLGARTTSTVTQSRGRYESTTRVCWLCSGTGSCSAALIKMWVLAGRPQSKEDL